MTWAPRGIDSTKSASSGRNARYPVFAVEYTTDPSGAPIRSSCAIAPRWVWKALPGSRTTVWCRPLGSVSCTRSPTRKAPGTGSVRGTGPASGVGTASGVGVGTASGVGSFRGTCCSSTGHEGTDGVRCDLRRGDSELSVPRPSLGPMTANLATDRSPEGSTERTSAADGTPRRPSLSPSRAADFKSCPLLYRFRTIDRLPEKKSRAAVRGTLVHAVLEKLYDLPPSRRTVDTARELIAPAWEELRQEEGIEELFATEDGAETGRDGLEAW